jgi:hypothetical protein
MKNYKAMIGILTGLVFIVSTAFAVDRYVAKEYAKQQAFLQLTQNFEQYKMEQRSTYLGDKIRSTEDDIRKEYNQHYRELRTINQICELNLIPDLCKRLWDLQDEQNRVDGKLN